MFSCWHEQILFREDQIQPASALKQVEPCNTTLESSLRAADGVSCHVPPSEGRMRRDAGDAGHTSNLSLVVEGRLENCSVISRGRLIHCKMSTTCFASQIWDTLCLTIRHSSRSRSGKTIIGAVIRRSM